MSSQPSYDFSTKQSILTIKGVVPAALLTPFNTKAKRFMQDNLELPGFRKGKVPEDVFNKHVTPFLVASEGAELFFKESYPEIVTLSKKMVVGRPSIKIEKLAPDNPLEFTIEVDIMPEFDLPDYKKVVKGIEREDAASLTATPEEIETTIKELAVMALGKDVEYTPDKLTLDLVQKFGPFETIDAFKAKITETIAEDKKRKSIDSRRLKMLAALRDATPMIVPQALIDNETDRMLFELEQELEKMKLTKKGYLEQIKKTEEELRKEWSERAKERVATELLIDAVSIKEKIAPEDKEVTSEVEHMLRHHPTLEKERVEDYVRTQMRRQKTLEMLEQA